MENYSLSDLNAVMGKDNVFGGSSALILIILFFLIFGWGGNGRYADSALNTYATASSQQEILFGQKFSDLDNKIDRIGNGICDSTYALNNAITTASSTLGGMITTEGRSIQSQIAECCCNNQRNVDSVRYDMANFASAINQNIDNKFAQLEKAQLEQTIANQASQINQLALAQQMAGVVKYPMASTYAMLNNPFCGCGTGCCN